MACVNPTIARPRAPGWWVDDESCVCGATYRDFRAFPKSKKKHYRFSQAADLIRRAAGGWESGGGFRSRRVVLWTMRVIKLTEWYEQHAGCEFFDPIELVNESQAINRNQ